jgi:hypothetical protein
MGDEGGAPGGASTGESAPPETHHGEETMLWYGGRPRTEEASESPSEDAAGEMEVASTGHRERRMGSSGTGLPGADELGEALASLDAVKAHRGTIEEPAAPESVAPAGSAPEPALEPPRRAYATSPPPSEPGPVVSPELRSPASRAYRRLRRIFPG